MKLTTIDCEYLKPQFAAAYLLTNGTEAAFIETNTTHAVPKFLAALKHAGLSPAQVRAIVITHVHLDHAGGAAALSQHCPNAVVLAHPRAAKHLIDPSKLIQSARKVYGDTAFEELYGEIRPIPAERVRNVSDGETFEFGKSGFRFIYTQGHANHHMCIHVPDLAGVFTGDAFGLAYPALQHHGLFIFPSTSPTDFDPNEALTSIDKILKTGASRAFLTHYGELCDIGNAAAQLREHIRFSSGLMESAASAPGTGQELTEFCEQELRKHFTAYAKCRNIKFTPEEWELLRLDLELNAAGIAFAAERKRS